MPFSKLSVGGSPDAMKADEENGSFDTLIRQAIGKEPLLSFPRTGDSPVQWIQWLHAFDQQDIPGWPFTSLKFQMQKCEKCSQEFCSPINYRRHIRLHRRSLNFDKESRKYRDLLRSFWDKLSLDELMEVASLHDISIKDIPGSAVVKALTTALRKPGIWTLPIDHVKAGSRLLDVIQVKPSGHPMTSHELFSILDNASERTFLCAGTAASVQKYVFDGEAAKIILELKNLVACTSFLFEQKLVKAWLADKDAEALRCQKLLVEEEEAAQKRQTELLEKKKLKKLRQKEQRAREQSSEGKGDLEVPADYFEVPMAEICNLQAPSDPYSDNPDVSLDISTCLELVQFSDIEAQLNHCHRHRDLVIVQNVEPQRVPAKSRRHFANAQWQAPKSQRLGRNGFHNNLNHQVLKLESLQKHGIAKDRGAPVNSSKIWTRKVRAENDESLRLELKEVIGQNQSNCELMIGSISVPVKNCSTHHHGVCSAEARDDLGSTEPAMPKKCNVVEKQAKHGAPQSGTNRAAAKLWRPVSKHRHERARQDPVEGVISAKFDDRTLSPENCLRSCPAGCNGGNPKNYDCQVPDGNAHQGLGLGFSTTVAKAFLAQRWNEAISADHARLVLSPDTELTGCPDAQNSSSEASPTSDNQEHGIRAIADNQLANTGVLNSYSSGNNKVKFRPKPEKAVKIKYIPKQKNII